MRDNYLQDWNSEIEKSSRARIVHCELFLILLSNSRILDSAWYSRIMNRSVSSSVTVHMHDFDFSTAGRTLASATLQSTDITATVSPIKSMKIIHSHHTMSDTKSVEVTKTNEVNITLDTTHYVLFFVASFSDTCIEFFVILREKVWPLL